VIALLIDADGSAEVLEAESPRGAVPAAVLLGPGEQHLSVPYSTWRDFLGKQVRVAAVQARATAAWPEDLGSARSDTCPRCGGSWERGALIVRTPVPLTSVLSPLSELQWRSAVPGAEWATVLPSYAERVAWKCRKCGGLWLP
jgi:hypothetical protein